MSTGGLKKRYTSAMEKIIKNAVSESSKVLETIVAELKAEVIKIRSENENLKIRCSQFEEVVKKRTVYRETGTSPEPYIIEKCDKAVQCDLTLHQPEDLNCDLSDNEVQSETSFGPADQKESSNDSFSLAHLSEDEYSNYDSLDETTKSLDPETTTNGTRPEQKNMESEKHLETPICSFDEESVNTISSPQAEQCEEHDSCCETSEMEIQEVCQEDIGPECVKTDNSLLDCQEERQNEVKDSITMNVQADVHVSKGKEPEQCEEECLLPELSTENAQQQVVQEMTEMDVEIDAQSTVPSSELKPDNLPSAKVTNAELGNILVQADNTDNSSVQDQPITPSKAIISTITPVKEQHSVETDETPVQLVPPEDWHANKAQKTSPTLKYPYFLRRQRCTSVTLEDAMLLLDAVNVHEYKSSKKPQAKNLSSSKIRNNPDVTFAEDSGNTDEKACTPETVQPLVPQTGEVLDEAGPTKMGIQQEHDQETSTLTSPSPLEAAMDHGVLTVTPTKLTLVTKADSVSMNIENKPSTSKQSPTVATDIASPDGTPTQEGETILSIRHDTANVYVERQEYDLTAKPVPGEPHDGIIPADVPDITLSKPDDFFQEVEVNETPSEMDTDSADDNVLLSMPAKQSGTQQATADPGTQNDVVNITPSTLASETIKSESDQTQAMLSVEPERIAQISGPTALDSEGQEKNDALPPKTAPNPVTQRTLLLKMPGETGNTCNSVLKTLTSSSTLSPAQLSAVVSAVRSTQNTRLSAGPSQNTPCGKKLVAVPFSLQSVMKPHHKIIVIPRQCKVPPSQPIAKEKAIILKKNLFQKEATTTVISTNDVSIVPCGGDNVVTAELNGQQSTPVTTKAVESEAVESEQHLPVQENSPCRNNVQVKLNRLLLPESSAQTVIVTNIPLDTSTTIPNIAPSSPPAKTIISESATSQPESQPVEETVTSSVTETSPNVSNKRNKLVQTSSRRKVKSASRPPNVVRLSPVVSNDHSYPQYRMTKSQFLAKLEVSPVTRDSEKAGSSEKDAQKASLVDRLRSHLKKVQDSSSLTIETSDRTSVTQETSGPNRKQVSVSLPDPVTHTDEPKSASPIKTSTVTKGVANIKQLKRKNGSNTDKITQAKPAKKRRLKSSGTSSENMLSRANLSPMRNKLINSNALLSCVRKGLTNKSFLCKFCRKEFRKKKDIEEHIQVHAGKKPFQCNICHRRFSRTLELSRHLKRHNAEKKFHCSFCSKAFIEYNNLKRHTLVHTGEKPYPCPHCPKAFTQSGHMRAHIKSHHKDIKH